MPHHLFYSPVYDPKISSPFESGSDLVLGLISKSRLNAEDRKSHSYLADFFENQLLLDLVEDDRTSTFLGDKGMHLLSCLILTFQTGIVLAARALPFTRPGVISADFQPRNPALLS